MAEKEKNQGVATSPSEFRPQPDSKSAVPKRVVLTNCSKRGVGQNSSKMRPITSYRKLIIAKS